MFESNFDLSEKVFVSINQVSVLGHVRRVIFTDYGKVLYEIATKDMILKDIDSVFVSKYYDNEDEDGNGNKITVVCFKPDVVDSSGTLFTKQCLSGINVKDIPVLIGFNKNRFAGGAHVYYDENLGLIANLDLVDKAADGCIGLYPAPSFRVIDFINSNGITTITKCELISIGLVKKYNNSSIKAIT